MQETEAGLRCFAACQSWRQLAQAVVERKVLHGAMQTFTDHAVDHGGCLLGGLRLTLTLSSVTRVTRQPRYSPS